MILKTIGFLIITLAIVALAGWLPAAAQEPGKVYRIGYLRFIPRPPTTPVNVAFRQRLRELGYIEGQNLVIEDHSARGIPQRRSEMAAKLVRLKVDVIVTSPAPGEIRAARQATRTIPIVMPGVFIDPVKAGFVASLARPGGNITGITSLESELHPKRLELLKEAFPQISRVAVLWARFQHRHGIERIEAAGEGLGIEIESVVTGRVRDVSAIEQSLSAISRARADGLIVATGAATLIHKERILEFAAKRRLPTIYTLGRFVSAGGLMSYGANLPRLARRAATYVDKILKGTRPADLPVEQPRKFDLIINLKTAKALGVALSPQFLLQADQIIK